MRNFKNWLILNTVVIITETLNVSAKMVSRDLKSIDGHVTKQCLLEGKYYAELKTPLDTTLRVTLEFLPPGDKILAKIHQVEIDNKDGQALLTTEITMFGQTGVQTPSPPKSCDSVIDTFYSNSELSAHPSKTDYLGIHRSEMGSDIRIFPTMRLLILKVQDGPIQLHIVKEVQLAGFSIFGDSFYAPKKQTFTQYTPFIINFHEIQEHQ